MSKPRDERQKDLFRPALDQIIDMGHPLVLLSGKIDWGFIDERFCSVCHEGPGHPPLPTRLVAGLFILKHMHNLSDEVLCARWIENPYYQFFCGEQAFRHGLPFDRSSMTRWRQRLGEEHLVALIQESLSVAHKTGALETKDLQRVAVDTTVQPKAIAHPTDARLMHRAIEKLVALAKRSGVPLRQSYARVAKRAAIITVTPSSKPASPISSISPSRYATRTIASVAPRSMRCMPRRSNALARAKRGRPTSSAARCRSQRRSPNRRAASSCSTPRRYTAIPSTATPSARS
jgi:IS5 family transposase